MPYLGTQPPAIPISGTDIQAGTISTVNIADAAVATAKIADVNVNTAKIANNAITTAKIANDAISTAKIANDAITTAKIANGAITAAKLALGASGGVNDPYDLSMFSLAEVQVTNSLTTVYTAPGGNDFIILGIVYTNKTDAASIVDTFINASSVDYSIGQNITVAGKGSFSLIQKPIVLMSGQSIKALASVSASFDCRVMGISVATGEYFNDLTSMGSLSATELLTDASNALVVESMLISNDATGGATSAITITWETNSGARVHNLAYLFPVPDTALVEVLGRPVRMDINDTIDATVLDINAVDVVISYRKVL